MKNFKFLTLFTFFLFANAVQASCVCNDKCSLDSNKINKNGIYAGIIGGTDFLELGDKSLSWESKNKYKYYVGGVLGYKFCTGLRLETELSYGQEKTKFKHIHGLNPYTGLSKFSSLSNDVHGYSWRCMANVLYDIDLNLPFTPYFGVGIGNTYSSYKWDIKNSFGTNEDMFFKKANKTSDNRFTFQGILGVKYEISEGLELGLEYRLVTQPKERMTKTENKLGLSLTQRF